MERSVEGNEFLSTRRVTSQLQRRFNRFCPGVSKVDFLVSASRSNFSQLLRQCRKLRVIEVGAGKMDELGSLLLGRLPNEQRSDWRPAVHNERSSSVKFQLLGKAQFKP